MQIRRQLQNNSTRTGEFNGINFRNLALRTVSFRSPLYALRTDSFRFCQKRIVDECTVGEGQQEFAEVEFIEVRQWDAILQ